MCPRLEYIFAFCYNFLSYTVLLVTRHGCCDYATCLNPVYTDIHNRYVRTIVYEFIYAVRIRISDFRCAKYTVLAMTDTGDILFWGQCMRGVLITKPRPLLGLHFVREIFERGMSPDSGGTVYLGRTFPWVWHMYLWHMNLHLCRINSKIPGDWLDNPFVLHSGLSWKIIIGNV